MRFYAGTVVVLALGALAVTGHSLRSHHGQEAVSYSVVTKHEDNHHGPDHGHHHELHEHHLEKDQHELKGHYEHHVEHYGNSGNDDDHQGHHGHHGHYDHHDHHEHHEQQEHHDHHDHPKYEFQYGVKDSKTGDIKDHWESRDGDSVKGTYSLKESDGTTRVVKYTSDKKKGFEATVHKIGQAHPEHGHN